MNYQRDYKLAETGEASPELLSSLALDKNRDAKEIAIDPPVFEKTDEGPGNSPRTPNPPEEPLIVPKDTKIEQPLPPLDKTEEVQKVKEFGVVSENTELKAEPDPFSETVTSIPRESSVQILDKSSLWIKVHYGDNVGYVMSDYVRTP